MNSKSGQCQDAAEAADAYVLERIRQISADNRDKQGSLIQVLHMVQGIYGHLPLQVQQIVASELELPLSTVSGVVSFYSFFTTEPRGKHTIRVCLGTACYVRGGVSISDAIQNELNVKVGRTTSDGMFTFEIARCIGACGLAPAMTIDAVVYPGVTPEKLPGIFAEWYEKDSQLYDGGEAL